MADLEAIRELLHQEGGASFPEALVTSNLVADWDLSRVVAEIFGLPFLPIELTEPDPAAMEGLDKEFLIEHRLVPLGRFGQVLTVCMPGLVPADTLGMLSAEADLVILPVVGTVQSNSRWIEEHLGKLEVKAVRREEHGMAWDAMFDDANAAVMMALEHPDEKGLQDGLDVLEDSLDELEDAAGGVLEDADVFEIEEADSLEFEVAVGDEVDSLIGLDLEAELDVETPSKTSGRGLGDLELPPLPDFD